MKYIDWQITQERFLAMTGYTVEEFNALLPFFTEAHDEYLRHYTLKGKPRSGQRTHVIYANSPLNCHAERLAFILSYKKLNPLQEHHADTFSMTQKQCNEFVHGLYEVLQRALQYADVVPANDDKEFAEMLSKEEFSQDQLLPDDGTEREIPRPIDYEFQRDNNSGKKKKHTVKNAVITTACCTVLFVSQTFSGKVHDKTIADESYTIPAGYTLMQDTGYQGYRPEGVTIIQPQKKLVSCHSFNVV